VSLRLGGVLLQRGERFVDIPPFKLLIKRDIRMVVGCAGLKNKKNNHKAILHSCAINRFTLVLNEFFYFFLTIPYAFVGFHIGQK
jgi:hypothetical protein